MVKLFLIALKDLRLAFRDRAALLLMLAAPFILTIGLGLVTGRFSGNANSGLSEIPVIVVNQDEGPIGEALAKVFTSPELAKLVRPALSSDAAAARQAVDRDQATAVVIIPAGFTESVLPNAADFTGAATAQPVQVEIYANPSRPTGAGVVEAIVEEFLGRVEETRTNSVTTVMQLIKSQRLAPEQAAAVSAGLSQALQSEPPESTLAVKLNSSTAQGEAVNFDPLAYIAPGMALMFLMYTVSHGGRSILMEGSQGTLPRLLVSPTNVVQILGGKVFGIFLTGAAQMFILIGATSLLFHLKWGDTLGVVLLVLAAVFGATGWGMLITALARTPGQVASLGSAIMLIFGILGGSLISLDQLPGFVGLLSKITPNAWALDGFTNLGLGDGLLSLYGPILALVVMGAVLFGISAILFGRRNLVRK